MEQERLSKGIWIPIEIWKDKNLTWNEKILFLEIDSYTSKDQDCFFSNEYISGLLGISETNANKTLSSLINKGYVIKTKFDGRRRYVKTALSYSTTLHCQERQPSHACDNTTNNTDTNTNDNFNKTDNKEENKEEDTIVSPKKNLNYQKIVDCWNEYNGEKLGRVTKLTERRKKAIKKAIDDNSIDQDTLMTFFKALPYGDSWLYTPRGEHKNWKPDFDWWMTNPNGWLTKALEGKVHKENPQMFEGIMTGNQSKYSPRAYNIALVNGAFMMTGTYYDGDRIFDGYSDDNRPDGAKLKLNNAQGTITWSADTKRWERTRCTK